jgi:hypothetical protein
MEGFAMFDWFRLRPTADQYHHFEEYLPEAHSWYKHLPLMEGRRFVVFVAPDAGIGRLVATPNRNDTGTITGFSLVTPEEGPEFTEAHPRLHYGWKTTAEYRSRFGYLDYASGPMEDGSAQRDAGPAIVLPEQLMERCEFVLYPYVSRRFAEAVLWSIHAEALAALRSGAAHPARDAILEIAELAELLKSAWAGLGEGEKDWVLVHDRETAQLLPDAPSPEIRRYLELDDRSNAVNESLREMEASKIRRALVNLDNWLLLDASNPRKG